MRVVSFVSSATGLRMKLDAPLASLRARERRTNVEHQVPFDVVDDQIVVDFDVLQGALPNRMGRYDILAIPSGDSREQTLDFAAETGLPIWRMYFRPEAQPDPMLPHVYINRNGSLSAVIRNPSYVDHEEREFTFDHELTSIRLRRSSLRCSFRLEVAEEGDFEIQGCFLRLFSNEDLVQLDASTITHVWRDKVVVATTTWDIPPDTHLPPLRYALYVSLRDRRSNDTIDLKLNRVSESFFGAMRKMSLPPATRLDGNRVFTLASPPTASLVSFIVRGRTRYDTDRVRQKLYSNMARIESRLRRLVGCTRRPTALIFEKDAATAQDNGFALFQHLLSTNARVDFDYYYVMDRSSNQWDRVEGLPRVVAKFSPLYWRLLASPTSFLASSDVRHHIANIYAQPGLAGKYAVLRRNFFLQHGVLGLKRVPILSPGSASFPDAIVASAEWEKRIMIDSGIPAERIDVVGLARWDGLVPDNSEPSVLLFMPTWREWLEGRGASELKMSNYVHSISSFLSSEDLHSLLVNHDLELHFLAHPKFPELASLLNGSAPRIKILSQDEIVFSDLIQRSAAVITDYSSIAWDFVQAHKPVLLYQFDIEQYQRVTGMYKSAELDQIVGKFPTAHQGDDVLSMIAELLTVGPVEWRLEAAALARSTFAYELEGNCRRTVETINARLLELSSPRRIPNFADADRS